VTGTDITTMLGGLWTSVWVAAISTAVGLPLGVVLGLLGATASRWVRLLVMVVVELLRGLPMLIVVYFIYFGLPSVGIVLDNAPALILGLTVSAAAYTSEIFRVGILDVPRGHSEAARSLGLTGLQEIRHVVLPQALPAVRIPIIAFSVLIFQYTSVGFAIGLPELLSRSYAIGSVSFDYLTVFLVAGAMYAFVSILASVTIRLLRRNGSGPTVLPA
jgi:polar amino acid transport system permease protein